MNAENKHYGLKSSTCGITAVAAIAAVLIATHDAFMAIAVLLFSIPVLIICVILGLFWGLRSIRSKETAVINRVGAYIGICLSGLVLLAIIKVVIQGLTHETW